MSDGHRRAQTVIQNILHLTNLLMAGKRVAVLGYEPELASRLRAMGAQTLVTDPAAALHGHRVLPVERALPIADLVIGASGEHLGLLRDGAILTAAEPSAGSTEPRAESSAGPSGSSAESSAGSLRSSAKSSAGSPGSSAEPLAGPSAGLFAGLAGTRVRDGITAYRLDPGREVFVLDTAYGPDPRRDAFALDTAC
jgi:hypothetical protein